MTRLGNFLNAVKILHDADVLQKRNSCRSIYDDIEIDKNALKIKLRLIFKEDLDKMDYVYVAFENDNMIRIQF